MRFQKITVAPKQLFSLPQMIDSGYIFEDESKQLANILGMGEGTGGDLEGS